MSVPCVDDFRHHIADVVDHIGVVAKAASHAVGTGPAVENIGGTVPGDDVGESIAGTVDRCGTGQSQVLDIGAKRIADRGLHRVGALR